mgnify:CR=1 FL=1
MLTMMSPPHLEKLFEFYLLKGQQKVSPRVEGLMINKVNNRGSICVAQEHFFMDSMR